MSITKQPEWLNNAVFYEIYPQSFNDTNADGIGDFNGIIEKLDYIRELGCNAIWINPCFKSPFGDAGYDVEDYYTRRSALRHERRSRPGILRGARTRNSRAARPRAGSHRSYPQVVQGIHEGRTQRVHRPLRLD